MPRSGIIHRDLGIRDGNYDWELISREEVSQASSITFPNLDGSVDREYNIRALLNLHRSTGAGGIILRLNDTTANKLLLNHWALTGPSHAMGSGTYTDVVCSECSANMSNRQIIYGRVMADNRYGYARWFDIHTMDWRSDGLRGGHQYTSIWYDGSTNITSMQFVRWSGLFSGWIELYRRRPE